MSAVLGYNTNGFAHHALSDALDVIAETGYRSVGLTVDVHHQPYRGLADDLVARGLVPVIETGARFLLDARRKHFPTLFEGGARIDFLRRCIDLALELGASCVSLWSGAGDDWTPLLTNLEGVCEYADAAGVDLGFEPEPGMFIATMEQYDELKRRLPHPRLRLTLDVGHAYAFEAVAPHDIITKYATDLVNVHLDDHKRGVHDHLMFGEGEIAFEPVLASLDALPHEVPATVELSRHSHNAVAAARASFTFLTSRRAATDPASS